MSGLIMADTLDACAVAYKAVRDATVCNDGLTVEAQLGILDLVKHEILTDALNDVKRKVMNDKDYPWALGGVKHGD